MDHEKEFPETLGNKLICRYMEFWKFESLLNEKTLFFSSIEKNRIGDPLEGSLTDQNESELYKFYEKNSKGSASEGIEIATSAHMNFKKFALEHWAKYSVISCWHINQHESQDMWQHYVPNGQGVAIESTVKKLVWGLGDIPNPLKYPDGERIQIYIMNINYKDYSVESVPEDDTFYPFLPYFSKERGKFDYEQELRVLARIDPQRFGTSDHLINYLPQSEIPEIFLHLREQGGLFVPVDLNMLIEKVIISPTASEGFQRTVERFLEANSINVPIELSSLEND